MKDTQYAFAVAQVRQYENTLLNKSQIMSLINTKSLDEALAFLASKGMDTAGRNYNEFLDKEAADNYEYVKGLVQGEDFLKVFTVKNDFQNLKAAVKALASNSDPAPYYVYPSDVDTKNLSENITTGNFDALPKYMRECAKAAYESTVQSGDGQLTDIIIDRATLETMADFAADTDSRLLKDYVLLTVNTANVKIAYRGATAGKRERFFEQALCDSPDLPKAQFCLAAAKGTDDVTAFIADSPVSEFVAPLKNGVSELEKYCDEKIAQLMRESALTAFGADPVIAFYWMTDAQIKNIRIILTCKEMGVDNSKITERVRETYV